MNATQDALQRAVDYLGAVEVAPGRYAYQSVCDNTPDKRWITFETAKVLDEGTVLVDSPVKMPAWWTPERRYAVRNINTGKIVPDAILRGTPLAYEGVTVDLETGKLIRADLRNIPREQFTHRDLTTGEELPA